ncbi:MAG: YhfC family intramembrane metalloprotease [Treponema sp.]|nr:YhfC family intramembrane metalloprotease [Treponema sp.]
MSISTIISIGLPIVFFIFIYKKYNAKFLPMIIGAAAFIIFVLVLEYSIHSIVFKIYPLKEKPFVYILYGILMASIFEETARLISFKILKKKYTGIETGLSYGIGHGGTEAVLIAGISMIIAIIFSILINTGNTEAITGKLQGEALIRMEIQLNTIITTAPYIFLISGVERIFAIILQISLSVIVFYSVFRKGKIWLFPAAILLHAVADIPAAAMQVNILKNLLFVECLIAVLCAAVIIIAYFVHKSLKDGESRKDL